MCSYETLSGTMCSIHQSVEVLRRGAVELLLADVPHLAFRHVAQLGRIRKRVVLVRYDPPVVHFAQTDGESRSVFRGRGRPVWAAERRP